MGTATCGYGLGDAWDGRARLGASWLAHAWLLAETPAPGSSPFGWLTAEYCRRGKISPIPCSDIRNETGDEPFGRPQRAGASVGVQYLLADESRTRACVGICWIIYRRCRSAFARDDRLHWCDGGYPARNPVPARGTGYRGL